MFWGLFWEIGTLFKHKQKESISELSSNSCHFYPIILARSGRPNGYSRHTNPTIIRCPYHRYLALYPVDPTANAIILGTIHPHEHSKFLMDFFYGSQCTPPPHS